MGKQRRFWVPVVAAVSMVAVLSACSSGGGKSSGPSEGGSAVVGDATAGEAVFMGTCATCHGPDARGLVGLGKSLVDKSDWMQQQTDESLLAMIKQGRPATDPLNTTKVDMPPKGGNPALSETDLQNVIAYIRSVQQ